MRSRRQCLPPFAFSPSSSNCATAFDLVRFRFVAHASMAAITFSGARPATTLSRLVAGLFGLRLNGSFGVTAFLGGLGICVTGKSTGAGECLVQQPTDHELGGGELLLAVGAGALHLGLHQFDEALIVRCRASRELLGDDGV
jgi:hypothetical protein